MVHPHFSCSERAGGSEMFPCNDIISIRREYRVVQQPERFFCDLPGIAAICIHHPYVIATPGIACKADLFSVSAEPRLHFKREAAAKHAGSTACYRHIVNI